MTINERNTRVFQGKLIDTTDINIVLRPGELSTDLTTLTLYVHDGVTPGGNPLSHGAQGPTGLSAYQVAVNNGFQGTEQQWLVSLVGPQGPAGQQGSGGSGGGTGTNYGIVTSSTEIVIATDYLGQQSGLLGHILDIPLNTLNQQIDSGWHVIFADGQTTATVGSAYTNGDHITLNLTVPGGTLFVQPAYPITVIGTTTLGATATNVVIPGYGLVLNSDGTLSVNSATIQGLLPIYEISGNPGITTIDNNLSVQGIITAPALTVSNFISFADGSVQTTAALSGTIGFGLQKNNDGTISVNSSTIQLMLPILEISQNNTSTTVIDNNTIIHGLIAGYALTVTNAIYFPDGTAMTTAATGNGGGFATTSTLIKNGYTVALSNHGKLSLANPFPITFTAVFDGDHFYLGPGGFRSLTGPATTATVTFAVDNGQIEIIIVPQAAPTPVGYQVNDYFNFTEADHGIPGYTLSILFDQINSYPNFPRIAVSPAPAVGSAPVLQFPDGTTQYTAGGVIQTSAAPVGNTSTIWYDTVGGRSYVYYDSSWVDASPNVQSTTTIEISTLKSVVAASTSFTDFQARIAAL
jgi:hypothetical protein